MTTLPSLGPRGEGWVVIQGILFAGIALAGIFMRGSVPGYAGLVITALAIALIAAGGVLAVAAGSGLQSVDALTAVPRPRDEARLIQSGPYRLVRHPIYGGLVLAAIGWALLRASPSALAGAVVLLVFFDLKRRREEAWLIARFPEYPAYRERTKRMLPWIF